VHNRSESVNNIPSCRGFCNWSVSPGCTPTETENTDRERERSNEAGNVSGGDVNGQEGKVVQRTVMRHLSLGRAENHRQQAVRAINFLFLNFGNPLRQVIHTRQRFLNCGPTPLQTASDFIESAGSHR
jgi:hypothetical protein